MGLTALDQALHCPPTMGELPQLHRFYVQLEACHMKAVWRRIHPYEGGSPEETQDPGVKIPSPWQWQAQLVEERRHHVLVTNMPVPCQNMGMHRVLAELARCLEHQAKIDVQLTRGWAFAAGSKALTAHVLAQVQSAGLKIPTFVSNRLQSAIRWTHSLETGFRPINVRPGRQQGGAQALTLP